MGRRVAALLVAAPLFSCGGDPLVATPMVADAGGGAEDARMPAPDRSRGGVFVHLFEWPWTDVARECETFLGPKGFAAVQVSPPSEHAVLTGAPWWQRYQTVGYGLDRSRSGTKAEFEDMVERCAAVGVGIYVDAVINHMTAQASGTGSNGTAYSKYEYPGLYTKADFHAPCTIAATDYTDSATRVQTCELLGLADLDTGAEQVQSRIAAYLIALVQAGVRGFRIDAAKHIAPVDLDAILAKVAAAVEPSRAPYYFFEVIDNGMEAIHVSDYLDVGRAYGAAVGITNFQFAGIGDHFLNDNGHALVDLRTTADDTAKLLASERAVVFTNNHDTQRNAGIFYQDVPYYDLATVFLLAWPYGYPSLMSSYAFDRTTANGRDLGPPSDAGNHTTNVYVGAADAPSCAASPATAPASSWVCEHRVRSAANMVGFRRATMDAPTVANFWDDGKNQIAFGRGDKGFVVINREDGALTRAFMTGLAAGTYCDIVGGDFSGGACTGTTVAVAADGTASITAAGNTAVAIHVNARLP
jgi:alpha-amylase